MLVSIFVLTFTVAVLNVLKAISIMLPGGTIDLPGLLGKKITAPERWYVFYPCFFYQVWFWFDKIGLFS